MISKLRKKHFEQTLHNNGLDNVWNNLGEEGQGQINQYLLDAANPIEGLLSISEYYPQDDVEFAVEAINALEAGGEVNFDNVIILDPSFDNNPKVKCVFQKLLSLDTSTYFKNIIVNLFGSSHTSNIKFAIGSLPDGLAAVTLPSYPSIFPRHSMYTITLDATHIANGSTLDIALSLIHEIIHAELLERCIQLGLIDAMTYNSNYNAGFHFTSGSQIPSTLSSQLLAALIHAYLNYSLPDQWNHNLITGFNMNGILATNLEQVYPLLNDPANDFLNNINNDPANTNGNFTLSQAMAILSWAGLEDTQDYINEIQNIPANLSKMNYIGTASTTKFTHNCP